MSDIKQPTFSYVIEMAGRKKWHKCKGKAYTLAEGRKLLKKFRDGCPDDIFRINVVGLPE